MQFKISCPACGAEVSGDLAPGEAFACPGCGASCVAPSAAPPPLPPWPAPAVGDPAFTPDRRAALLRALRAEHDSGELPEGSEAFVASMFSPSRLESIGKRAKSGADLSEADALYMEHYTPVYAATVDELERKKRRAALPWNVCKIAFGVFLVWKICGCIYRGAAT